MTDRERLKNCLIEIGIDCYACSFCPYFGVANCKEKRIANELIEKAVTFKIKFKDVK